MKVYVLLSKNIDCESCRGELIAVYSSFKLAKKAAENTAFNNFRIIETEVVGAEKL